jgi:hypothetical protein
MELVEFCKEFQVYMWDPAAANHYTEPSVDYSEKVSAGLPDSSSKSGSYQTTKHIEHSLGL